MPRQGQRSVGQGPAGRALLRLPALRSSLLCSFSLRLPALRSLLLGLLVLGAASGGFTGQPASGAPEAAPRLPGPWPVRSRPLAEPLNANAACESCHVAIAAEWRESMHSRAHSNPAFRSALSREPLAFCERCHAPEADPARQDEALQALGVACITCHVVDGAVLSAPTSALDSVAAPHPLLRTQSFSTPEACGRCHEFDFPNQSATSPADRMQSTLSEHEKSEQRDTACAGCHMPLDANGKRSHRFALARDEASLRAALEVEARRLDAGSVEFVLKPRGVGHAFPTGDLFRRLRVRAEVVGQEYDLLSDAEASLTRTFATRRSGTGAPERVLATDSRLQPGEGARRLVLELPAHLGEHPVHYAVTYERVAHPVGTNPADAVVESSVTLASGKLPPIRMSSAPHP